MSTQQPAWVLSRKHYGDNGLLVEFFTAECGRCGAVVRGANRKKRGGSFAMLLQPFQPLLVSLVGKSELKYLRQAGAPPRMLLRGESLMSGLYLNELLSRVLPRFDAMPSVFVEYSRAIERLHTTQPALSNAFRVIVAVRDGLPDKFADRRAWGVDSPAGTLLL